MSSYSTCCHASVTVEETVELFHGSDDDYELKIPFIVCNNCNKIQLTVHTPGNRQRMKQAI